MHRSANARKEKPLVAVMKVMVIATGLEFRFEPMDDDPPRWVTGTYVTRYVEALDCTQHVIDGIVVDPATVEIVDDEQ